MCSASGAGAAEGGAGGARAWCDEDEAVIATNSEATEVKRGAVELGYWKDDFVQYFARRGERKPPEIYRGYYARVHAMEMFVYQFLERAGARCQIINLGCGFDTLYWRLGGAARAGLTFIELDFPQVTAKKCHIIKRNKRLLQMITTEDGEVAVGAGGSLVAGGYRLAGCDLRCAGDVRRALAASGAQPQLPTLALAECVLVYLRAEAAAALLRQLLDTFPRLVLVAYEQCNLGDRFGEVLRRNLAARGVAGGGLAGLQAAPPELAARLAALGFGAARAWDMGRVWRALPAAERRRVERLQPLDEHELLQQLHAHYALSLASQGDLFADMDLNADDDDSNT